DIELRDLDDAIRAKVLVAQAPCDLVVAADARHHQKLLQLLRGLRQREELARMQSRRNDEVARALWRALEQHGRLDLDELARRHVAMNRLHHAMPQLQRARHLRPAEVQVAVLESRGLVGRHVVLDLERRSLRFRDDLELLEADLHIPGREPWVLISRPPAPYGA